MFPNRDQVSVSIFIAMMLLIFLRQIVRYCFANMSICFASDRMNNPAFLPPGNNCETANDWFVRYSVAKQSEFALTPRTLEITGFYFSMTHPCNAWHVQNVIVVQILTDWECFFNRTQFELLPRLDHLDTKWQNDNAPFCNPATEIVSLGLFFPLGLKILKETPCGPSVGKGEPLTFQIKALLSDVAVCNVNLFLYKYRFWITQ